MQLISVWLSQNQKGQEGLGVLLSQWVHERLREDLLLRPARDHLRLALALNGQAQAGLQGGLAEQLDVTLDPVGADVGQHGLCVLDRVVLPPELPEDCREGPVLLLHLLVVAAALLGLPTPHELLHGLENLVHAPHVPVQKVARVQLEEPVIPLILLLLPVAPLQVFLRGLLALTFFLGFFLGRLLANQLLELGAGRFHVRHGLRAGRGEQFGEQVVAGGLPVGVVVRKRSVGQVLEAKELAFKATLTHFITHSLQNHPEFKRQYPHFVLPPLLPPHKAPSAPVFLSPGPCAMIASTHDFECFLWDSKSELQITSRRPWCIGLSRPEVFSVLGFYVVVAALQGTCNQQNLALSASACGVQDS